MAYQFYNTILYAQKKNRKFFLKEGKILYAES